MFPSSDFGYYNPTGNSNQGPCLVENPFQDRIEDFIFPINMPSSVSQPLNDKGVTEETESVRAALENLAEGKPLLEEEIRKAKWGIVSGCGLVCLGLGILAGGWALGLTALVSSWGISTPGVVAILGISSIAASFAIGGGIGLCMIRYEEIKQKSKTIHLIDKYQSLKDQYGEKFTSAMDQIQIAKHNASKKEFDKKYRQSIHCIMNQFESVEKQTIN